MGIIVAIEEKDAYKLPLVEIELVIDQNLAHFHCAPIMTAHTFSIFNFDTFT